MLAVASMMPRRGRLGLLPLGAAAILGTLLLVACGDPPAPAPASNQTPKTQQPALRPRAVPPASTVTPAPTQTARPATTTKPTAGSTLSQLSSTTPDRPGFTQVATGENHSCALLQDGRVRCWGPNDQGQLNAPAVVRFHQITSGWRFSCGLRTDGGITCWGRNNHKQADAPDGEFLAVDAGWDHACGLSHGFVVCWGRDANGRASPPTDVTFATIGAGAEHSCGLTHLGDLRCWGKNNDGRSTHVPGHSGRWRSESRIRASYATTVRRYAKERMRLDSPMLPIQPLLKLAPLPITRAEFF